MHSVQEIHARGQTCEYISQLAQQELSLWDCWVHQRCASQTNDGRENCRNSLSTHQLLNTEQKFLHQKNVNFVFYMLLSHSITKIKSTQFFNFHSRPPQKKIRIFYTPRFFSGQTRKKRAQIMRVNTVYSWFQTFAVFWMLCALFWVIHRRLQFICQRFEHSVCSILIGG
jgi:hypothetical protein